MDEQTSGYLKEYRDNGKEAFFKAHPHAFLICADLPSDRHAHRKFEGMAPEREGKSVQLDVESIRQRAFTPQELVLREIVKTDRNPFAGQITVGRARNNDIQLSTTMVSKFHGYFSVNEYDQYTFTDQNSSNGTYLNREKLKPREAYPIKDKDSLRFSQGVPMKFLEPGSLILEEILEEHKDSVK